MSGKVVNLVAEQRIIIITCSFVSYEHTISMMTRYVGNQVFFSLPYTCHDVHVNTKYYNIVIQWHIPSVYVCGNVRFDVVFVQLMYKCTSLHYHIHT